MKKILLASAALIAFGATAANAQDLVTAKAGTIKLDVRVTGILPDEDAPLTVGNGLSGVLAPTLTTGANTGLKAEVDDSYVPTIGLEYYLTDNISVEAIAGTGVHEVTVPGAKAALGALVPMTSDKVAKVAHLPPTVTAKYHFNSKGKFSPYVGAGVTYIWFYSEDSKNNVDLNLKDGFGYAVQLGLDVNTASKWSYNVDVKKIFFETDAYVGATTAGGAYVADALRSKVTLDPLVVSVGFGYKF